MNWINTLTGTMKNTDCHYGSNAKTYALCKQKGKQGSLMMLHGNALPNHAVGTGNMKNRSFLKTVENTFHNALASNSTEKPNNSKPNLTTKANNTLKSNNSTKKANNTLKSNNSTKKANNSTKKPNISATSNKLINNHSTKKNRF